ncbi:MAG: S8 family peptidase [Anaerolineales bacterium]
MSGQKFYRQFICIVILCLLTASLHLQAQSVYADAGIETETPTETFTLEPTSTLEDTPTVQDDNSLTPTATETILATSSSISSQTPTPTITAAPIIQGKYVLDEVLVRFKKSATDESIAKCLQQVNGSISSYIEELSVTIVKLNGVSVSNAVATLSACEDVRYVEPNYLAFSADRIPNDSAWPSQYGLVNIHAPQGWAYTTGSSNITIAIVDTGVDLSHPDLANKIVGGYDFVNNDSIAQDDNGHGTHVAGIAAAVSNNGTGVAGVSWGARIMPVKVLTAAGGGTFGNIAAGIIWAADHGANVINLSLGGIPTSIVLQNAVNYADSKGVLIIAAVGNAGGNLIFYPAAYSNVIAVGSTDTINNHAVFSNYGSQIDLVAPGVAIYSTSNGGTYSIRDGTSMSTAFVSGFAALLLGIPGNNAPSLVRLEMESTALDLGSTGWDGFYGNGLIQMDAAIKQVWPTPSPTEAQSNNLFSFGGFPNQPTFTPTMTSSATAPADTATLETSTLEIPTFTIQPENNGFSIDTETPEVIALDTNATRNKYEWIPPCISSLLILIGLLLFWYARSQKKREPV